MSVVINYPETLAEGTFGEEKFICDWRAAAFAAGHYRTDITEKEVRFSPVRYRQHTPEELAVTARFFEAHAHIEDEEFVAMLWEEQAFQNHAACFVDGLNALTESVGITWVHEQVRESLFETTTDWERSKVVQENAGQPIFAMLLSCPELSRERIAWHFCCGAHGQIMDWTGSVYAETEQYVEFLFRPQKMR